MTNSNFETGQVNIYNIQGKVILKDIKLQEQSSNLDISNLENGLYFVELILGNSSTIQKLIVDLKVYQELQKSFKYYLKLFL